MRVLLSAIILVAAAFGAANAQRVTIEAGTQQASIGFTTTTDRTVFALVGCNVAGANAPTVRFVQLSDGIRIQPAFGRNDLQGESCAEVLTALWNAGLRILDNFPVQQNANREFVLYNLILRGV